MKPSYNCLSIKVSHYLWLVQDKALEITQQAVEEIENGFIIRTEEPLEPIKSQLSAYVKELEEIFKEKITLEFKEEVCANEDWIAKYRDSITPIECGKYYIHPSWFKDLDDKINVVIDPALAFGSGHHATTFGCLKALEIVEKEYKEQEHKKIELQNNITALSGKKILDVGCGSGILSICAKKSGAIVYACDTDEVAICSTKENAQKNGILLDAVTLGSLNALSEQKGTFDVVMANILADIIVSLPLDEFVKPKGYLILSGILEKYITKVLDKFKDFRKVAQEIKDEWATLVLQR